jgi:hypothetical protein
LSVTGTTLPSRAMSSPRHPFGGRIAARFLVFLRARVCKNPAH